MDEDFLDSSSVTSSEVNDAFRRLNADVAETQDALAELRSRHQHLETLLESREETICRLEEKLVGEWSSSADADDSFAVEASRRDLDEAKRAATKASLDLADAQTARGVAKTELDRARADYDDLYRRLLSSIQVCETTSDRSTSTLQSELDRARKRRESVQTRAKVYAHVASISVQDARHVTAATVAAVTKLRDTAAAPEEADSEFK